MIFRSIVVVDGRRLLIFSNHLTSMPAWGQANPCNPCGGKKNACNPCNPCGGKKNACNPCDPCNPCGGKMAAPKLVSVNPCHAKFGTVFFVADPMKRDQVTFLSEAPLEDIVGSSNEISGYFAFNPSRPQAEPLPWKGSASSSRSAATLHFHLRLTSRSRT